MPAAPNHEVHGALRRLCDTARDALHRERDSTCMRRIISRCIYAELKYRSCSRSHFLLGIRAFGRKRRRVIARETRDTIAEKGRGAAFQRDEIRREEEG